MTQRQFSALEKLDASHHALVKSALSRLAKAYIGLKEYSNALNACGRVRWLAVM